MFMRSDVSGYIASIPYSYPASLPFVGPGGKRTVAISSHCGLGANVSVTVLLLALTAGERSCNSSFSDSEFATQLGCLHLSTDTRGCELGTIYIYIYIYHMGESSRIQAHSRPTSASDNALLSRYAFHWDAICDGWWI